MDLKVLGDINVLDWLRIGVGVRDEGADVAFKPLLQLFDEACRAHFRHTTERVRA